MTPPPPAQRVAVLRRGSAFFTDAVLLIQETDIVFLLLFKKEKILRFAQDDAEALVILSGAKDLFRFLLRTVLSPSLLQPDVFAEAG